jgi:hypothetical protein
MNERPETYSFQRYLSAKRTVDDRALNRNVWDSLHSALAKRPSSTRPLTILEVGGGIGTMVERLVEDGRLPASSYHLLDEQAENIETASNRLQNLTYGAKLSRQSFVPFKVLPTARHTLQQNTTEFIDLNLYTSDLYEFLRTAGPLSPVDLVLAHAFMDLVNIPATLPLFTSTLSPGALLYFTINFDGATILEPAIDPEYDAFIEQIYHRTMDERITNGNPSGDSHTGRHLFHQMKTANIQTLDAGSSDWVVIPHHGEYPNDESYFLHFIVNTMYGALRNHPEIEEERFSKWIYQRHRQIEAGELVYIAHQLDYLGQYQPTLTGASIETSRPSA